MFTNKSLISSKEFEKLSQIKAEKILKGLGLGNLKKIPRGRTKTPDYEADGVAYEVTVLHTYMPLVVETLCKNEGERFGLDTHALLYADKQGRLKTKILFQGRCQPNLSILRVRHDISCYRRKIISKIRRKYKQGKDFKSRILFFDFRLAPFDSVMLGTEISSVLDEVGVEYPRLVGIIVCIPKFPLQSVVGEATCFFVENPYTSMEIPTPLKKIKSIPKSEFIVVPFPIKLYFKAKKGWNKLTLPAPQFLPFDEVTKYFQISEEGDRLWSNSG
jgi:hypothetical protein